MLPFTTKTAQTPRNTEYPENLNSLGNHIRTKRLDLDIEQKVVAKMLQVTKATVWNWENNRSEPEIKYYPAIMDFLRYCPYVRPKTWGEQLKLFRTHRGLTFRQLAKLIEIDSGSLQRWEKCDKQPWKRLVRKVEEYFRFNSSVAYPYTKSIKNQDRGKI